VEHTPSAPARIGPRWAFRLWRLGFAILIPVWGVAVIVAYVGREAAGLSRSPLLALELLMDWSLWVLLVPAIVHLVRRFPLDAGRWVKGIGIHVALGGAVTLVEQLTFSLLDWRFIAPLVPTSLQSFGSVFWYTLSAWFPYALLFYFVIAVATHAVEATAESRRRELEAAELREHLTGAQLQALRMQLHPHFLFNTLNTATVLVRDGRPREAVDLLTDLGDLLSRSLDSLDRPTIPLRDELAFISKYLGIEKRRFSDRLRVDISVGEGLGEVPVPAMILQPLVENAMRHGIAARPGTGTIEIEARREGERIALLVRDDGPGVRGSGCHAGPDGRGVGLRNTRKRLARAYGGAASLTLRTRDTGGAEARMELPLRNPGVVPAEPERPAASAVPATSVR